MMSSSSNFIAEKLLSLKDMAWLLATKKQRRLKKGIQFNCLILDRARNNDELTDFLIFLAQQRQHIPELRFQLIVRSPTESGYHWSTLDVCIKPDSIQFFLIDAANVLSEVLPMFIAIHTHFPNSIIRYSGGQLQVDGVNCATFAYDHAVRLAKIPNLHEELAKIEHQGAIGIYPSYAAYIQVMINSDPVLFSKLDQKKLCEIISLMRYVSLNKFPASFGPLIRNMQDLPNLKASFFPKRMSGNDRDELEKYLSSRVQTKLKDGEEVTHNISIDQKRERIKRKALLFQQAQSAENFEKALVEPRNYREASIFRSNK